ncbi:DNA translocase FtsK [Bacillus sp. FJAT-29790]|uniref:DNA translocase FtsK n=1 Tax=Bacillus sp. FJAT-29790 TaxID=1895002 RepID=UPI001C23C143|nr:DNA translocase FtsK [Bacillus sp. FJAT-29790]MBU8879765.1 DNA translocase FtsK [Bacillus sp. FJAT-29790]
MSWIKKLFGIFKNDDEDENRQEYMEQKQVEREFLTNSSMEPSKDVNAKVVYQYPKGQFRFPVIPDERNESLKRVPKVKREEKREQPLERHPEKRVTEHVPNPKHKKNVPFPKSNEIERVKKIGPFRPTEIPSPIYGFERSKTRTTPVPVNQEPIEFELNDVTYNDIKEKPTQQNTQKYVNKDTSNIQGNDFEKEFQEIIGHDSFDNQMETLELHAAALEVEESIIPEIDIEQSQGTNIQEVHEEWEQDNIRKALDLENERGIEVIASHVYPDQGIETAGSRDAPEHISETNENLAEMNFQRPDTFEESTQSLGTQEIIEVQTQTIETNELLEEAEQSIEVPVENKSPSFNEQEPDKEEKKSPSSSRAHIPFNVIMLNKDKQKLAQQLRPAAPVKIDPAAKQVEITETKPPIKEVVPDEEEISYYEFPSKNLLTPAVPQEETSEWLHEQEQLLNSTLKNFNVGAKVVNVTQGPAVTRYEVQPEPGVKVNKITNLSDDIKLSLAARDIRIEAPIPGKHTIGIEVPNRTSRPVFISEIINSPEFINATSPLTAVLGLDISGSPIVTDLRKMPHGLIAGATGSGKSVCINTILVSLLYKANPDELKLILIDPKMVELAPYNRIPHLVSPVITDVKAATAALKWAVEEMERRYELFAHTGVRDIGRFNELAEENKRYSDKLPFIVIIIDELADLMMMSPADVEEAICRIAQKARACGIHLIIATQRPSVDVITGLIKANVPTRIAFSVSSQIDSRTIIDISGAEKLLGRGDMLFLENGSSKPVRLQGTFVSDKEIDDVVAHVRRERDPEYLFEQEELLKKAQMIEEEDELFYEACEFVVDQKAASTSSLQRRFKIGYNRAARLIDMMEQQGLISENRGSKPRDVLITEAELESLQDTSTIN